MVNLSAGPPHFFNGNFRSGWNDSLKFCTLRIYIRFQSWAKSQNCPIYLISFRNILLCGLKFSHITLHSTQKSLCWRLCFLLLCMLGDTILPYRTDRTKATFFQNKDRRKIEIKYKPRNKCLQMCFSSVILTKNNYEIWICVFTWINWRRSSDPQSSSEVNDTLLAAFL